jgi:hypothetical protein
MFFEVKNVGLRSKSALFFKQSCVISITYLGPTPREHRSHPVGIEATFFVDTNPVFLYKQLAAILSTIRSPDEEEGLRTKGMQSTNGKGLFPPMRMAEREILMRHDGRSAEAYRV